MFKDRKPPNWDRVFDFAVRAQFYRECVEELKRISEEGE